MWKTPGWCWWLLDENGISVTVRSDETFEVATNPAQVERVVGQLRKSGDTEYDCYEVEYHDEMVLFYTFFRGEWLSSAIIGCFEPGTGRAAGEMGGRSL